MLCLARCVESIAALLQQQLHVVELSAMNQREEASYDAIAWTQMEQKALIWLVAGHRQLQLVEVLLV